MRSAEEVLTTFIKGDLKRDYTKKDRQEKCVSLEVALRAMRRYKFELISDQKSEVSRLKDENKILNQKLNLAGNDINNCRHYLMSTEDKHITSENALLSLGLDKNGDIIF